MPPAVYPTMEKDGCPKPDTTSSIDPFPGVFEQDSWQKLSFSGPGGEWHYIVGEVITDGETLKAIGVPGRFSESAPPWLNGFTTHQSSPGNEGYWLKFIGLQPEERRSPRLSQHDE